MGNQVSTLDPWRNASLANYERGAADIYAMGILSYANTGCLPLRVAASDGNIYYAKLPHNRHGQESLLAERVVASAADYLGAPTAVTKLLAIPDAWTGQTYSSEREPVRPGTAHASRLVEGDTIEDTELRYIPKDGNRSRGAAYVALWEWCGGFDGQWLYDISSDYSMWTFDHGLWIGGGPEWAVEDLPAMTNIRTPWEGRVKGLAPDVFMGLADRLEACTVNDVMTIVASVPVDWGFNDAQLTTVAKWLYDRRSLAAQQVRVHASNAAK